MKRHFFTVIFIFVLAPWSWSQNTDTSWVGHFSYLNIKEVVSGDAKFYAASETAIFSYDPIRKEMNTISTINGLSGELISTLHYSSPYETLIIGYENGLIEVYNETSQELFKVVDIINNTTIPSSEKRINHFNEFDEVVYIATDYGISVFNLENLEFGDTYFIGENGRQINVNQTTIFNTEIYAACGSNNGIKKASLSSPSLIDFQSWTSLSNGNFNKITAFQSKLYTINTSNRIYEITGASLSPLFTYPQAVKELKVSENTMLVTTFSQVYQYTAEFNVTNNYTTNLEFETSYTSALTINDIIYIGTTDYGVLKSKRIAVSEYQEIHPEGPLLNSAFSLEYGYNNLWVTFGAYSIFFNPYPLNKRGISNLRNTEWNNISYDSIQRAIGKEVYELNKISTNPLDPNHVFVSSFHSGLLDIKTEESITLIDQSNSGLESIPSAQTVRISGAAFDDAANLWVLNSIIQKPLKKFNPSTNQWTSYDFSSIITNPMTDENGFSEIVIGPDGTKWIGGYKKGLIGFNETGMLLKNIDDEDVANLPSTAVKALAMDNNNVLWIGTYRGLRVLYNTSNFFNEGEVVRTEPIIILEDGLAQELLAQQFISDIIVDGANNKWISTADAGVFYVSSDGQNTIHHFTKDNSPLPSNGVNDMALDSENGIVYFGTNRGLVSFKTGGSSTTESLESVYIYPNPVRPGFNMADDKIKIKNISDNVNIKITDIEGNLVAEAQSNVNLRYKNYNLEIDGGTAYWNGKNLANNTVASGVYLVLFSNFDTFETKVSKLMIVR
ncbi:ABC transporter substrate-binding protein [Flavobacteriaceae bacterium]|nr:ABC transporter substrate-binding protein [Flavobacteriaceae bacterium]MDC1540492.1 ABC transporter substrate-binding protein [Flavobacteriaceae bacterium]